MNDYGARYSALSDASLIELMHEGGLTEEAYEALKNEMEKRKIQDVETHQFIAPYNDLYGEKSEGKDAKSGLRGWLLLFSIGLILPPVLLVPAIVSLFNALTSSEYTLVFERFPALQYIAIYELVGHVIALGLIAVVSFYYFRKKSSTPRIVQLYLVFCIGFSAVDVLWNLNAMPNIVLKKMWPDIYKSLVSVSVNFGWMRYFKQSKRVKNTFIN